MLFSWRRNKKSVENAESVAVAAKSSSRAASPTPPSPPERLDDPVELARRIGLLLMAFYHGQEPEDVAKSVLAEVAEKGQVLTREEWDALIAGAPLRPRNDQLLLVLGEALGVTVPYLSQRNPEQADRVEAQLELMTVLREEKIESFRACGPGGQQTPRSADEIRALTRIVREAVTDRRTTQGPP